MPIPKALVHVNTLDLAGSPSLLSPLLFSQWQSPRGTRPLTCRPAAIALAPSFAFILIARKSVPVLVGQWRLEGAWHPCRPKCSTSKLKLALRSGVRCTWVSFGICLATSARTSMWPWRECTPNGIGKCLLQCADGLERGTEVVAPLADAMRFVDNDGSDIPMFAPGEEHGKI